MEKKRARRLGYKKTTTGCLKCRKRKVKCGEQRPSCATCERLGLECQYSQASPGSISASTTSPAPSAAEVPQRSYLQQMETKFLHAYMARALILLTEKPHGFGKESIEAWFMLLPKLAMQHDNLLYALLAFSGTQVVAAEPDVVQARDEFWATAIREQRKAILSLSYNLEAAILAGYLLCMTAFGMLRGRSLQPYVPPLSWFELAQGARTVCPVRETLPPEALVLMTTFKVTAPLPQDLGHLHHAYEQIITFFLEVEGNSSDALDHVAVYRQALVVISGFRKTVVSQEPPWSLTRWICTMPQILPTTYIDLLRAQQPCALTIMICFWTLLAKTHPIVLRAYGDVEGVIPRQEMEGILINLPASWRGLAEGLVAEAAMTVEKQG